jgi:hypothetical protein
MKRWHLVASRDEWLMAYDDSYTNKAMKDHANTYAGFLSMMKWSIAGIALVLFCLATFVA